MKPLATSLVTIGVISAFICASSGQIPYGNGSFHTAGPILASPAYSPGSDTISVSSKNAFGAAFLYTLSSGLTYVDTYKYSSYNSGERVPTPAVGNDGTIYIASENGILHALSGSSLTLKWSYDVTKLFGGMGFNSSPTIGLDGNIYIPTDEQGGLLFCIDPDLGLPKWVLGTGSADIDASLAFTTAGIYTPDEDDGFRFITFYGQEYWSLSFDFNQHTDFSSSPAVGQNGLLYMCIDGSLNVIDPVSHTVTDSLLLANAVSTTFSASPVIGPTIGSSQVLYVGSDDGHFWAVSIPANGPPTKIAETTLNLQPTTAAVASDSTVYVGDSAGFVWSMSLQPASGGSLPYQFNINWQIRPGSSRFTASPLLASVGAGHADNVLYVASEDNNVYAFQVPSGPSTSTWSTFHGNDMRQGSWGSGTIPPPQLINVQFGPNNGTLTAKTGKAAYGNSWADYWNPCTMSVLSGNNCSLNFNNLSNAAGHMTSASISLSCHSFKGYWTAQGYFNDPLMKTDAEVWGNDASGSITISGLSTVGINGQDALYDIYLYGSGGPVTYQEVTYSANALFTSSPAGKNPLDGSDIFQQSTASSSDWDPNKWVEGNQYVVFRNVHVSASNPNIAITVAPDTGNPANNSAAHAVVNGIQIVPKQAYPPPSVSLGPPFNGQVYDGAPTSVKLSAHASDPDGHIIRVDFYVNNSYLATANQYGVFIWNNVPAGTYSIFAIATDNVGAMTISSPVLITVTN